MRIFVGLLILISFVQVADAAGARLDSTPIHLGVNDYGHLGPDCGGAGEPTCLPNYQVDNTLNISPCTTTSATTPTKVGLYLDGVGDAIQNGCMCEGWGVVASGANGRVAIGNSPFGVSGLILDSFTSTASTATSVVHLQGDPDVVITHAYQPAAEVPTALFESVVTIQNNNASAVTSVKYKRVMDWDVPPDLFDETVTIQGWPATNASCTGNNGFDSVDPTQACSALNSTLAPSGSCTAAQLLNTNFTDCGSRDQGSTFLFDFGTINAGESRSFTIYYGAATSEASALEALAAVGAEMYSLGQWRCGTTNGNPATFIFGFKNVGGTALIAEEDWGWVQQ